MPRLQGYQLAVELEVLATPLRDIGLNDAQMKELVKQAHELCPYSRATRGNIVRLSSNHLMY
jgi:osmotically inducible protein OsmC